MKLHDVIAEWILVRTFGYATKLLHKLDDHDPAQSIKREHLELLRGVCAVLYRQIQILGYPMMSSESPTTKRFMNQWP